MACVESTPSYIPGDVDGNGVVNGNDLNIILSNYGATSGMTWGTGDLDGSGTVNGNDLNIVLSDLRQYRQRHKRGSRTFDPVVDGRGVSQPAVLRMAEAGDRQHSIWN